MDDLELREKRRIWKLHNRGVLAKIAEALGFYPSFVSEVFNGTRHSEAVAKALREAKAPGFEEGK